MAKTNKYSRDGALVVTNVSADGAAQEIQGAGADGAVIVGDPVLIAGQDGTNTEAVKTDSTGRIEVIGAAADGAAEAGNPVLIAGSDGSNAEAIKTDSTGRIEVIGGAASGAALAGNPVIIAGSDGTNAETMANNQDIVLLASAARTADTDSGDQTNVSGKGLHLVIDITVDGAAASITFTIEGKDSASGKYYDILVSAARVDVGTTVLRVHPDLTAAANLTVNDLLPRTWRLKAVTVDADEMTYSVGASVIH